MTSYHDELIWAYDGEVLGEAMFASMAAQLEDRGRAGEMAVMAMLERQTREQLGRLLAREGIVRDDNRPIAKGEELGERSARANWDRFLASFAPLTSEALVRYRTMRDDLAPESDRATMDALVTHEEVLQAYADRAIAGEGDPAAPVVAALEGANQTMARLLLDATA